MILVISASLHPESRSRILARACVDRLSELQREVHLFDLAETPLPPCDGATAYGDANVQDLGKRIESASAILIASPVYNYDVMLLSSLFWKCSSAFSQARIIALKVPKRLPVSLASDVLTISIVSAFKLGI